MDVQCHVIKEEEIKHFVMLAKCAGIPIRNDILEHLKEITFLSYPEKSYIVRSQKKNAPEY